MPSSETIRRVLVATDGSSRANRAVDWARELAGRYDAELHLIRVVVPKISTGVGAAERDQASRDEIALRQQAEALAGERGRAHVVIDEKPAYAICRTAAEHEIDAIVLGNAGMSGRKEFLLGNVPNWVSHNAPCTVIIVNTNEDEEPGGWRRLLQKG
ncbi:MAG: universal stress protein [Actinobacteria bacterium]|nr:universal stress protein [Actinomycetota bacterium]